jgi:1-deoxyxylulose-5-phosphate synthase
MQLEHSMNDNLISRRQFLGRTAALAGAASLVPLNLPAAQTAGKRTAVDQVTLGKTGIKLSRLGIGVGSNSGNVQRALGHEAFNKMVRYAYDQGITYIDTADSYKTHEWVREAIKGLPREKLYIQSKMGGSPDKPMEALDRFRKELGVDYIDTVLVHCATSAKWTDERKRVMDALSEAQEKKIIRAKGVSCHSLPALALAAQSDWVNVNLVRVNPQAKWIDGPTERWDAMGTDIAPVMKEIKTMDANGHGVIGMKMVGNGEFTNPEDREKAIRFAMSYPEIDAVVVGVKSTAEIAEAIERINRALA